MNNNYKKLLAQACHFYELGNYEESLDLFLKLSHLFPTKPATYFYISEIYFLLQRFQFSYRYLSQYIFKALNIKNDPPDLEVQKDPYYFYMLCCALNAFSNNQPNSSMRILIQMLKTYPNSRLVNFWYWNIVMYKHLSF